MSKFKFILALTFAGLAMAATPIKDLVLQSNMDAGGFNITNVGDISNGDEVISLDGGSVTINPASAASAFDVQSTAGKAISVDSAGLLRLGTHGFVSANTNDVVFHGSVEFLDGPVSLYSNVITQVGSLQFSGGSGDQGTLSWNADDETIDLNENGTTLQIGQELHIHVRNDTGTTITNGTVVAFAGTIGASSRLKAELFTADGNTALSYLLGVATENISNGADGKVTSFGKVRGIDTSAWPEGTALYASSTTAGGFVTNAPASPAQAVIVAYVINSHASTGSIEVILDHHNENGEGDSPWSTADSGATLYATNDVVEVRGSGLSANEYQFVISNDVHGVTVAVDEDGQLISPRGIFNKEPDTNGDESAIQFVAGFDTRFTTLSREFIRLEASPLPYAMTFNEAKRDNDLYIYSDVDADTPFFLQGSDGAIAIHTDTPESGYGLTVSTNAYIEGPIVLTTEGTATNHMVTKAYVDDLHWKSYNLIAPAAPPYGGDSGSEVQAALTVTNASGNSLVFMQFDEDTENQIGPYYIALEEVRTNVNWEVDFHYWTDTSTGTVVMAIGYVRGLEATTWFTNNCPANATSSVFTVESFDIDANIASDTSTRWYIKRVAADASDTAGDFNFVNGLLNIPLEK